ncbi:GRB10-interacting GYF protein 2 isoform X1 [Ranitomeya imitator]|uniref:GRB10-interacting GYF protein 2 isoform X1 n=1 Tax=Ranitomeya imitator TaxID=111125 RepID=UPI0037E6FA55
MTAETQTLNFGPEWLRALSSGGSVISPPLSPALPKYKLADYRYGREEMLALYVKDNKVPSDLLDKEFLPILKEEPLLPLALVPFTEEEQRNFSMSVNSAAVLRLMGRGSGGGGGTVVGAPRGRSSSRGRGRGRGEGGFYQRSFDEVESGFGRGAREMHRSQSWEERGDRRFEKPARKEAVRPAFEEGGTVPAGRKYEFIRAESGNWRSLKEEVNGEEEEGGGVWRTAAPRRDGERWRSHSPDGARGPGWREHPDRRRRFDFDFRERDDERGYRRTRSGSGSAEDERDSLPEWCLEDAEDETGTFDSSGAFLPSKKVQKECIPEEQEMDFRPSLDGEEHSDSDGSNSEDAKETEVARGREQSSEMSKNENFGERAVTTPPEIEQRTPSPAKKTEPKADSPVQKSTTPPMASNHEQETKLHTNPSAATAPTYKEESVSHGSRGSLESAAPLIPHSPSPAFSQSTVAQQVKDPQPGAAIVCPPLPQTDISSGPSPPSVCAAPGMGALIPEPDEEDGLEHLEQQAQQMVAYLQDGALDDERLTGKAPDHRVKGHSPENQQKWYYKDPQGEIQGPFSSREMAEWYQAGYFPMTLLLRRVCDEAFQPLGEIIKLWGRVPFITPPAPRISELGPEHIGRHPEMTAIYQMQQLHYQQLLIQQQYAQVMAQQQKAALSSQQQQQLALLLQQFQTLKMRISEQPVIPTLPRTIPVPDNTPLWELQTAAPPPTMWEGSSVWDLPAESTSQGASREQLEQLEKAKAAKIEQERREAELRAKQEEEEQRRRLEEEERKRKEELELARRKQEEALRRQREQELALRRQIEEEERKREEERRLLEERRRQEEERRRQEEERRRLEDERKRLEEEKRRKEEEKKREEEEKRKREELQRKQEEAARWAREEEEAASRLMEEARLRQEEEERKKKEEAQRQKELQRQRQQQQEALRRLQQQQQQQQLAQMKLPSSSTWGQQVNPGASPSTLSLAEIQKLEEERERQNQEEQRRLQQELKSMQQQQQQQQKTPGWGNAVKPPINTKSLLEIQQEEARQMKKLQQQQQQAGRSRPANVPIPAPAPAPPPILNTCNSSSGNSVWGNLNNNLSPQWSSDSVSSIWSNPESKTCSGFWDDAVKVVAPRNAANKNKSNASKSSGLNSRQSKKVEQEEKLVRLFQGATKCPDSFTQWCEQTLHALNTAHSLDVPTFVSFLREVESPYEVHDYVRAYLGDTPEAKDFSKQFLERRNKQKTVQQKPPQVTHDSGWALYQTSQSNSQQTTLETAQSAGRKKKKQKMVRADPSLLGFSVNASSERLNMGEIETLEDY